MTDRAMQALYLLGLDPIVETQADPNSYGFRLQRGCADALVQCHRLLCHSYSPCYLLEGDIQACFDQIAHAWLLAHVPMDRMALGQWLKAGYLERDVSFATTDGTPQGGVASPALANRALDGLERRLAERSVSATQEIGAVIESVQRETSAAVELMGGVLGAIVNDWTLTAIVTLQSGVPIAVTQTTNFNAFAGFGVQRPNLVGNPELPADQRTTARWFETSAFAVAPQFTIGSSSRNPVRGPGYRNVDASLMRRIGLAGRTALEVRVEAFNLLNTPPFGAPSAVLGAANFGTITSAGDPRVIQLALKLAF